MAFSVTSGYVFKDGEVILPKKLNLMFSSSTVTAINGTPIGNVTPSTGSFTTIAVSSAATFGTGGTGTNTAQLIMDGGSGTGGGGLVYFRRNSVIKGIIGDDSSIFNGNSNDLAIYADSGSNLNFYTNASATPSMTITPTGVKAVVNFLASDGTVGLTQASTTTVGKSLTFKNGLCVAFS